MEKSKQIEILKLAKTELSFCEGLCGCIIGVLYDFYEELRINLFNIKIEDHIPSFNRSHVTELCLKNNLPIRLGNSAYWWDIRDKEIRLKVLDLLIKELEDENKNS